MSNFLDNIRKGGEILEKPLLISHVESHLIFGPFSRHFALGYAVLFGALVGLIGGFFSVNISIGRYIGRLFDKLIFLFVPLMMLTWTRRQQAILGWIAIKSALGIAAFMMATIGAGASFLRGDADAWPNLFLGLIWIPGVEFIPKFTPNQRYITIARIILSVPCVYFGVKSGNWHW